MTSATIILKGIEYTPYLRIKCTINVDRDIVMPQEPISRRHMVLKTTRGIKLTLKTCHHF